MTTAERIADLLRQEAPDKKLTPPEVPLINEIAALWDKRTPKAPAAAAAPAIPAGQIRITPRIAAELAGHEALVREAYKDSKGIWTWAIGVTNASGHSVYPRYKDNPQSIERCFEVYVWLLETKYAVQVRKAFAGYELTEAQFAAALSFNYNTEAILRAEWVKHWKAGKIDAARAAILNWRLPPEIIPRREKERDLFFDGKWSGDGTVRVLPVRKPSYQPDFSSRDKIDALPILEKLLA